MNWLRRHPLYVSFLAFGLLFLLAPGLDLCTSGQFYRIGAGFPLAQALNPIHKAVPLLSTLIVAAPGSSSRSSPPPGRCARA